MAKKYRVEYDREGCIGAAACVAVDPDHWEMVEDGKADFHHSTEDKDKKIFILEIEEDKLNMFKEAAEACPVNVIHIIDLETGKKII